MIERNEHLTLSGFLKVVAIKSVFPTGLSDSVKAAFPDVKSITKPLFIPNSYPLNEHWIAGFTQADGSFGLRTYKSSGMRQGYTCQAQFRITQHERDLIVLRRILKSLDCGNLNNANEIRQEWCLSISNSSHLAKIIIPFFP